MTSELRARLEFSSDVHAIGEARNVARLHDVRVEDAPVEFVAVTHPSLRAANVGRRRYRGHEGHVAEVRMLQDALRAGHRT